MRIRTLLQLSLAAGLAAPCRAEVPKVADMVLTGMSGPSKSTVSRGLLLVGRYLYVSGEPGLQTIDVSDPRKMCMTSDYTKTSAKMNGAAAKGSTLYVTNWHPGEGLLIFDISNRAVPKLVKTMATPNYSWTAEVAGKWLDVGVGNETKSAIVTYDISDPQNPTLVSQIQFDDRLISNAVRYKNFMYFTYREALKVYDMSDPANPKFVSEQVYNALLGTVKVFKGRLYMLESSVTPSQTESGLRVYSLADPAHPESVFFWNEKGPRSMSFQDDTLVMAGGSASYYLADVSDPSHPKIKGEFPVAWPGTKHGGYPVSSTGADGWAFLGTTGGNDLKCLDMNTCWSAGARVYSVKLEDDAEPWGKARPVEQCFHPRPVTAAVNGVSSVLGGISGGGDGPTSVAGKPKVRRVPSEPLPPPTESEPSTDDGDGEPQPQVDCSDADAPPELCKPGVMRK